MKVRIQRSFKEKDIHVKKKHQEAYGHRLGMAHGVELAFVLLIGFFVGVPQFCILVVVVAN